MVANIFGKIFAIQGRLNAQNTVSRLARQITRLTRDIGRAEKQHNAAKRAAINAAKQQNYQDYGLANASVFLQKDPNIAALFDANGKLDMTACTANKEYYSAYQQSLQNYQTFGQQSLNETLAMIEDEYDYIYEIEIQALKDQQADMETEKATAEAQLKMYEGMEQTEGKFADSNIKSMFQA